MKRTELIKIVKKFPLSIETYKETFKIISDTVTINNICFRNVTDINFVENTLWIDNKTSIDIEDVESFIIRESEKFQRNGNNKVFKIVEREE